MNTKTGSVVGWVIIDGQTGEQIMRCASRAEARELVKGTGGRICMIVVIR